MQNRFVAFKVKKTSYNGKKATAVYMRDCTRKIKSKIDKLERQEIYHTNQQTQSYSATVCHELRTPLGSVLFFLKLLQTLFP